MARYQFRTNLHYPCRLSNVTNRPIENTAESQLTLLRFEFEVFVNELDGQRFRSTGKIASRDLVIGVSIDDGILRYARALKITHPLRQSSWNNELLLGRWTEIVFAATDPTDFRNPFLTIAPLETVAEEVIEYEYKLNNEWFTVSQAADDLGLSAATIRRKLVPLEQTWGERLVQRTEGGHRRICLPLLKNLL